MSLKAVSNKIIVIKKSLPKDDDIVMPEGLSGSSNKQELGEVYSVGPGKHLNDGTFATIRISVGANIYFNPFGQITLKHEDNEYFILTEDDILAVVN